jgi:APA family basic amino acid/polyamine antiporter
MSDPKRTLNLFDTVMIVSGSMIGSGIFIVSSEMLRLLGSPFWVLICWLISGFITLIAALSYGELAGMMPQTGGQFIYLKKAFGNLCSFVYGWTVFTVIQTGVIAAVAVAFARYTGELIPFFDEAKILFSIGSLHIASTQILAVVLILFLTWLNSRGINNGKIIQRVFTSAKIMALLGLIIIAFIAGSGVGFWHENLAIRFTGGQAQNPGLSGLLAAMGLAFIGSLFSSDAWNNVTFIAGEIKKPEKNIPLGLLIGVLIVTILYLLANVAYFILLPVGVEGGNTVLERGIAHAQNDRVGSAAMHTVFGSVSSSIMAILIVVSTFGCNNGLILSGGRLFQSMAKEGLFFPFATRLNAFGVPAKAMWIQAGWAGVLCLSGSYGKLLDYCTFASLVFYIITITALFWLRKTQPDVPRPYRAVGYPLVPALYILIAGGICVNLLIFKPTETLLGIAIMLAGIPIFYFFKKQTIGKQFHQ